MTWLYLWFQHHFQTYQGDILLSPLQACIKVYKLHIYIICKWWINIIIVQCIGLIDGIPLEIFRHTTQIIYGFFTMIGYFQIMTLIYLWFISGPWDIVEQ